MNSCKGCINEERKSKICYECPRNYPIDRFIYKDKIIKRYAIIKGNILISIHSSLVLAKQSKDLLRKSNYRIAKMVEER